MGNCVATPAAGMFRAARAGDVTALRAELERSPNADVNMIDLVTGHTLLSMAARHDQVAVVVGLLARGANVKTAGRKVGWRARSLVRARGGTCGNVPISTQRRL